MATSTQNPNGSFTLAATPAAIAASGSNPNAAFMNPTGATPAGAPVTQTIQPTTPATPAPTTSPTQPQTPSSPAVTVNVGNTPSTSATTPSPTSTTTPPASTPAAAMPASGSIVDLLNQTGAGSSYADRSALAQKFGVAGYTGTAAQNTDLAKKYLDFFNSKKDSPVPDQNPRQDIADATKTEAPQQDPEKTFIDNYASMNPAIKSMYDTIQNALSTPATTQTFQDQYKQLVTDQGIPGLQTDLMNIKNVMDGTENDIRTEIQKAGGLATESQVAALTGARNKTLLVQANNLQSQLQLKDDYVNQIMQFSQMDRADAEKQVDQKLNLTSQLATLQDKIVSAAKDNYQKVVDTVGYKGLADSFKGDTNAMHIAEQTLGLPQGALSNATWIASTPNPNAPKPSPLQYVSGTANQSAGTFNPNTGKFMPTGGGSGGGSSTGGSITGDPVKDTALSTILASGKFTKDQTAQITNAIKNGEDPFTVIKNNAKNIMGQTEATKLSSYEAADSSMKDVQSALNSYYDSGGDTSLLSGTLESTINKLGQVKDPKKVVFATQVAVSLQAYRNAISGTAYSNQEGEQINSIFPGINKSHGLNDAVIKGRLTADQSIIDGIYKTALGAKTYDALKQSSMTPIEKAQSQLQPGELLVARENADGTRHLVAIMPNELWATDIKQ